MMTCCCMNSKCAQAGRCLGAPGGTGEAAWLLEKNARSAPAPSPQAPASTEAEEEETADLHMQWASNNDDLEHNFNRLHAYAKKLEAKLAAPASQGVTAPEMRERVAKAIYGEPISSREPDWEDADPADKREAYAAADRILALTSQGNPEGEPSPEAGSGRSAPGEPSAADVLRWLHAQPGASWKATIDDVNRAVWHLSGPPKAERSEAPPKEGPIPSSPIKQPSTNDQAMVEAPRGPSLEGLREAAREVCEQWLWYIGDVNSRDRLGRAIKRLEALSGSVPQAPSQEGG